MSTMRPHVQRQENGFALPVVIVVLGALAFATLHFVNSTRALVRDTGARTRSAQAEAAANAGINIAVLHLVATRARRSGSAEASNTDLACAITELGASLYLHAQDEGGKIDLNYAKMPLLAALFAGTGATDLEAQSLAAAIVDFRDPDDNVSINGAERAAYRQAGLMRGPKNGPFADIQELTQVLGMSEKRFETVSPFITVHSGREGVDAELTSSQLIDILVRGEELVGLRYQDDDAPTLSTEGRLPARFASASLRRYYAITSEAVLGDVLYIREAIVDIGDVPFVASKRAGPGPRIWQWRRGALRSAAPPTRGGDLPPC